MASSKRRRAARPKNSSSTNLLPHVSSARKINSTILAIADLPAEKLKAYESNASDSPLLNLPPEIRNRIYRLVLTGNTIHVSDRNHYSTSTRLSLKRSLQAKICRSDMNSTEDATAIQAVADNDKNDTAKGIVANRWRRNHRNCSESSTRANPHLSLLQVCRQIHNDAALLFYQENTFSFTNILDLEGFTEFLIPAQVKAVQHLTFHHRHAFKSDAYFEKRLQMKFGNLKSLVIFVNHSLERREISGCLLRFRRIDIKSAMVVSLEMSLGEMQGMEAKLMEEWVEEKQTGMKKKGVARKRKGKGVERI